MRHGQGRDDGGLAMLKGFLSGLAVSAMALAALSLAVPLVPDPAAGSPAPAPVLVADAITAPAEPRIVAPAAYPSWQPAAARNRLSPVHLPPPEADRAPQSVGMPVAPSVTVAPDLIPNRPATMRLPDATASASIDATGIRRPPLPAIPDGPDGPLARQGSPDRPEPVSVPHPHKVWDPDHDPTTGLLMVAAIQPSRAMPAAPLLPANLRSDRLPQIGTAAPAPEALRPSRLPARERHAAAVAPAPADRPQLALMLIHHGRLPDLPATLVFDPLAPDAAEAARAWRAAGGEIAILATGLPPGADMRDAEVTLQSHLRSLPEAVALVDLPEGGIGRDRILAAQIIAILAEDGHGLVTHRNGLNAPLRMAESAGVAAVSVSALIEEGTPAGTIRRILDQTALRATRDNAAVVIATATPDILELLSDWIATGRGRDLSLVPLSVLLNSQ
jgi:uncharacterized protein